MQLALRMVDFDQFARDVVCGAFRRELTFYGLVPRQVFVGIVVRAESGLGLASDDDAAEYEESDNRS